MHRIEKPSKDIIGKPAKIRAWCIYQLALRGSSLAAVAAKKDVTKQAAYSAFSKRSCRMEKAIANALQLQPYEIWPERYDKDKLPIRGKRAA